MWLVWERKNTRAGSRLLVMGVVPVENMVVCQLFPVPPLPRQLPLPPLQLRLPLPLPRRRCCVRTKIWATSMLVCANKLIATKCPDWRSRPPWRKRRARPVKSPVKFRRMCCVRQQLSTRLTTVMPFSPSHNNSSNMLPCSLCHLFVIPLVPHLQRHLQQ